MADKTFWQWLAATTFFAGILSNIIGWLMNSVFFLAATLILWGTALWCVVYRPVGAE